MRSSVVCCFLSTGVPGQPRRDSPEKICQCPAHPADFCPSFTGLAQIRDTSGLSMNRKPSIKK